jgi:hypothetical protein
MIEKFKNFNESRNRDTDYSVLAEIARSVVSKVFKSYESGNYKEDTSYHYGNTITWSNGIEEKGYTIDSYELKIYKPWLLIDFLQKDCKRSYFTIIDRKLTHKSCTMDYATIIVSRAEGISSKRKELRTLVIWAGEEKFTTVFVEVDLSKGFSNSKLTEIEREFKSNALKLSEKDIIKSIFEDWISTHDMINKTVVDDMFRYDFRKFVKYNNTALENSKKLNKFNDLTGIFKSEEDEKDYLTTIITELRVKMHSGKSVAYTFFKYFYNYKKDGFIYSGF